MRILDKSTWGFSRNTKKQLFGVPCKHPLPLPLGEVAERSEDGEGKQGCNTLSVTYGDSSPGGRAKGLHVLAQEIERIGTDTLYSLLYDCPIKTGLSCGKITP